VPSITPAHGPAAFRLGSAVVDAVLALALFGTTVVLLSHGGLKALRAGSDNAPVDLDWLALVLAAGSTLPLVAAHRWPVGVFVATAACSVGLVAHGLDHDLALGAAVALYVLASRRDPAYEPAVGPSTATIAIGAGGALLAYLVAAGVAQHAFPAPELLHTTLAWAAAWFAGERTRLRHAHIVELHDRAVRAEREAERERRLATAEERARIARDLHDSAGHAINVIAVRAGAARLRHPSEPDRSLQALEAIEELARQTAADIDHIVGNLREAASTGDGDGDGGEGGDGSDGIVGTGEVVEAPPGLASLDTLVARHTAAGLAVAVEASGPVRPLSAPADQAAYRILQEALTNAARHGTRTGHTRLRVAYGDRAVELTVTNPVDAAATTAATTAGAARPGGGHGLVGMRERATLLGGELDAGRVDGTFRVRARIPYAGAVGP
jgi:signal transduction histidine kinase